MNYIVFAFAAAAGIALIMIGILSGKSASRKVLREDENGYLRPVAANESTVFTSMLADLSNKIRPVDGNLETRLRKSGWVYQGPMEYHAKRMTLAILFFLIPVVMGMILKGSFLTVALLATGAAVFGFITPDRKIVSATKARKKTIQREMGFGLEQISLMLY